MKRLPKIITLSFLIPVLVAVCLSLTGASHSEASASGLTLAETCAADGTASLYFGWQGTDVSARELWLDVGYDNNWRPGTFYSAGPLNADTRAYNNWTGFPAGSTYYIRVNQLSWDGTWDPSRTVNFTTFGCGVAGVASSGGNTSASGYASPSTTAFVPYSPPTSSAPAPNTNFIPYAGNGGGPTLCKDGMTSHSSGSGTCSGHGGIAH